MKTHKPAHNSVLATIAALFFVLSVSFLPMSASAEWIVNGDTVTFTDHVGYNSEGTAYSGAVSLRMQNAVVSGQQKIVTAILSIVPEPGFSYSVKKNGGANGSVEIVFASSTCSSKFSFLYKPGLTRIDYGVMRCK